MLWAVFILAATSVPMPAIDAPAGADKGVHWILYFVLGALSARAVLANREARVGELALVFGAILLFAALDELHQHWIPGRSAEIRDWVADAVGSVCGMTAVVLLARRRPARVPRAP